MKPGFSLPCLALAAALLAPMPGSAATPLQSRSYTYHNRVTLYPAWSPDGKRLIFSSGRETIFKGMTLWTSSPDTDTACAVTHGDWSDQGARFSPDGKSILFMSNRTGSFVVYQRPVDVDTAWAVTDPAATAVFPCWFHDNRRFAYVAVRSDSESSLCVRELGTGREQILYRCHGVIYYPCVSPDDRTIYFSANLKGLQDDICRIPVAGGQPEIWCDVPGEKLWPIFTPDGGHILFSLQGDDNFFHLWSTPLASPRSARALAMDRPNAYYPQFSPDGKSIAFCSTDETRAQDIWIAPWSEDALGGP
jgi:Tol biopolymer transport system component